MKPPNASSNTAHARDEDPSLVARIVDGDRDAFQELMRRHNTALFRAARSIVRNDADAEDVLQEAYISAYRRLHQFRGDSRLATWLTRIVINQALCRIRTRRRDKVVELHGDRAPDDSVPADPSGSDGLHDSPEQSAMRAQTRRLIERKIDELPLAFRTTFVLREVEEWTIEETAECLAIPEATVRTRVFRARALLRASLAEELDIATGDVFGFAGERCDRIVAGVLARVQTIDDA